MMMMMMMMMMRQTKEAKHGRTDTQTDIGPSDCDKLIADPAGCRYW